MAILRFHWDFFGPDAEPTAEHFLKHVDQFCAREGISGQQSWVTKQPVHCTATLECDQQYMIAIRDALRPKRAERVLE
ncbi:MAG TPA: hypothetical protein PK760_06800 [Flavobacteriales bacterium]|nr:hypothetical protein [Flavobacteriales bacterium]